MTKIEWTQETWNPVTGCTPVSPGCAHCYAETMATTRLQGRCGYPPEAPPYSRAFDVTLHPSRLGQPLRWRKPREVFVCSMGDLFHADVPFEYVAAVWGVMAATPHRYQVLTKRPERMAEWFGWMDKVIAERLAGAPSRELSWNLGRSDLCVQMARRAGVPSEVVAGYSRPWPLPNVWLGTTVEDQTRADERIRHLLRCPAAGRFLSAEPLLGAVDLSRHGDEERWIAGGTYPDGTEESWEESRLVLPGIDGVIVGGETGPGARPMHPDWVRSLRGQCQEAGVAFFFKQWGGPNKKSAGRLLDGRTHDDLPWRDR